MDQNYLDLVGIKSTDDHGLVSRRNDPPNSYGEVLRLRNLDPTPLEGWRMGNPNDVRGIPDVDQRTMYRDHNDNYQDRLFQSQGVLGLITNGLLRTGLTAATKTIQGFGYIGGLLTEGFQAGVNAALGNPGEEGNVFTRATDNVVVNAMKHLEENIKANLPVYKPSDYHELGAFEKMFSPRTALNFWADEGADGLAFMLSTLAPAAGIAKLGIGARWANRLARQKALDTVKAINKAKGANAGAAIGELTSAASNIQRIANNMDRTTAFMLQTSTEAMFEADGVYQSIMDNPELNSMDKEEKQQLAATKARDTYYMNLAFLAPSNLFEIGAVFKNLGVKGYKVSSRADKGLNLGKKEVAKEAAEQIAKKGAKETSKNYLKDPVMRDILLSAAAEGLYEENIQYSIEQLATDPRYESLSGFEAVRTLIKKQGDMDSKLSLANLSDQERLTNVLLGSALGGGMTAFSNAIGGGERGRQQQKEEMSKKFAETFDEKDGQLRNIHDIFEYNSERKGKVFKSKDDRWMVQYEGEEEANPITEKKAQELMQTDNVPAEGGEFVEPGSVKTDAEGNPIIDEKKFIKKLGFVLESDELNNLREALDKDKGLNPTLLSYVRKLQLANMAHLYFQAGQAEDFFTRIDSLRSITNDELAAFGFDFLGGDKNSDVNESLAFIEELEKLYNNVEKSLVATPGNYSENNERKEFVYKKLAHAMITDSLIAQRELASENEATSPVYSLTFPSINRTLIDGKTTDELITEQLKSVRDNFVSQAEKVTHPTKGLSYFTKNKEELNRPAKQLASFRITEKTTSKQYNDYLEKYIKVMRTRAKFETHKQKRLSRSLPNLIKDAESPMDLLALITEARLPLTKESAALLKQYIGDFYAPLNSAKLRLRNIEEELEEIEEEIPLMQKLGEDVKELQDERTALEEEKAELVKNSLTLQKEIDPDFIVRDGADIDTLIDGLVSDFSDITDKEIKESFIASNIEPVARLMNNFVQNPQYSDLNAAVAAQKLMANIAKLFLSDEMKDNLDLVSVRIGEKRYKGQEGIDKLQMELSNIVSEIAKRKHNRSLQDKNFELSRLNEQLNLIGVEVNESADGDFKFNTTRNAFVNIIIEDIGEGPYVDIISEHMTQMSLELNNLEKPEEDDEVAILEYTMAKLRLLHATSMETILSKMSEDGRDKLMDEVESQREAEIAKLEENGLIVNVQEVLDNQLDEYFPALRNAYNSQVLVSIMKFAIPELRPSRSGEKNKALVEFGRDGNLIRLRDNLGEYSGELDADDLNELIEIAIQLKKTNAQIQLLENYDIIRGVKKNLLAYAKKNPELKAPSFQQWNAVFQLIYAINRPTEDGVRYQNMSYLKGLAATGKTSVVVNWALAGLGIASQPQKIALTAPNSNTLKPLVHSVNGATSAVVEEFIISLNEGNIPEEVKVIVVDEVGKLNAQELENLDAALRKFNASRPDDNKAKVLVLGDPNQISHSRLGSFIEQYFGSKETIGLENMAVVDPLTIRYRSDIPIINDTQDLYLHASFDKVEVRGSVNVPTGEINSTPEVIKGVYVDPSEDMLLSTLKNSIAKNPDRTRIVIVNDIAAKEKYERQLGGLLGDKLEVLVYVDSQGFTRDEVYMDMPYDQKVYGDVASYNDARYVASSRAVSFLLIREVGENGFDDRMGEVEESISADKNKNKEFLLPYLTYINSHYPDDEEVAPDEEVQEEESEAEEAEKEEKETVTEKDPAEQAEEEKEAETNVEKEIQAFTEKTEEEKQEEANDEVKTENEAFVEDKPLAEAVETPPRPELDGDVRDHHVFDHPTPNAFKPKSNLRNKVDVGLQARIDNGASIPLYFAYDAKNDNVVVITPASEDDAQWVEVAVLSVAEVNKFGINYEQIDLEPVYDDGKVEGGDPKMLGFVHNMQSEKLGFKYAEEHSPLAAITVGGVLDVWEKDFFGDKEQLEQKEDVAQNMQIGVFTSEQVEGSTRRKIRPWKERYPTSNIEPEPGHPYIVITGWKTAKMKSPGAPQLIPLTPRRLRKDDEIMKPIQEYMDTAENLDKLMDEYRSEDAYTDKVFLGRRTYARMVAQLSNFYYEHYKGYEEKRKSADRIDMTLNYFGAANPEEIPMQVYEAAVRLDELAHGPRFDKEGNYKRRDGRGQAQLAFDEIARSSFGNYNEKGWFMLRSSRSRASKTKSGFRTVSQVVGKNLLGNVSMDDDIQYSFSQEEQLDLTVYINKRKKAAQKRGERPGEAKITQILEDFLKAGRRQKTLTLEQLKAVFEFSNEGDSITNNGFGIRHPLKVKDFKIGLEGETEPITQQKIDMVETDFAGVKQTKIVMKFTAEVSKEVKPEKEVEDILSKKKPARRKGRRNRIDPNDVGLKLTKERYMPKPTDQMSKDDIEQMLRRYSPSSFLSRVMRFFGLKRSPVEKDLTTMINSAKMAKAAGEEAWGLYKDGMIYLESDHQNTASKVVARHEMFHKIFHEYTTARERKRILAMARKELNMPLATDLEIEEALADQFMVYQQKKPVNVGTFIVSLFKRLARMIGLFNSYVNTIDSFFDDIENGAYRTQISSGEGVHRNMNKIIKHYGSVDVFLDAKDLLLAEVYNIASVDEPQTFLESLEFVKENLFEDFRELRIKGQDRNGEEDRRYIALNALIRPRAFKNMIETYFKGIRVKSFLRAMEEAGFDRDALEDRKTAGIKNEIMSSELVDERSSLSQVVKTELTIIQKQEKYKDENGKQQTKYVSVPFQAAYRISLDALMGIDSSNFDNMLTQLEENMYLHKYNPNGEAVYNFFKDLINSVKESTAHPVGYFTDFNTFVGTVLTRPVERREGESTKDFFDRIDGELREVGDFILRPELEDQFVNLKRADLLSSLIHNLGSMRQKNSHTGLKEGKTSRRKNTYGRTQETGAVITTKFQLEDALINAITSRKENFVSTALIARGKVAKTEKERLAFVRDYLREIGFGTITVTDIGTPGPRLKELVSTIVKRSGDLKTKAQSLDLGSSKLFSLAKKEVKDQSSLIGEIRTALANSDDQLAASNILRQDGKTQYQFVKSSFSYEVLKELHSPQEGKKERVHLQAPIYKHNGYLNDNGLVMYNDIDHDAIGWKNLDIAVRYRYENREQWVERNFLFNFMATLDNDASKFVVPTYTISNKPNITSAQVNLLKNEEDYDKQLLAIIQSQMDRPHMEIDNYSRRYNKHQLVGLAGEDVNARSAAEKLPIIKEHLEAHAKQVAKELFDSEKMTLSSSYPNALQSLDIELETKKRKHSRDETEEENQEIRDHNKEHYREVYEKLARVFVYNYYIHSYNMNQLLVGDVAFYKDEMDVIKRISIFFGNGNVPTVNDKIGMKETFNHMIIDDVEILPKEELMADYVDVLKGRDLTHEATDAAGFILPEFFEDIRRGTGLAADTNNTLKPVYAGIDADGVPTTTKYSLIVLTDELVEAFPKLRTLRDTMEKGVIIDGVKKKIHEAVFKSGKKSGIPSKRTQTKDNTVTEIEPSSVLTLESRNLRLQFNPYHDFIHGLTTNPGQFTYFPGAYEETIEDSKEILRLNREMISEQRRQLAKSLALQPTGEVTDKTFAKLRRRAVAVLEGSGNSRVHSLSDYQEVNENGKKYYAISDDNPLLTSKIFSTMASITKNNTVQWKFPGGKFVLQSEFGTYSAESERLNYKDKDGFTEIIMPDVYRDVFKEGDMLMSKEALNGFAFRLPTSGLHLGMAFKIKGFYPTDTNVIIAPSAIVSFTGADYDIDSLFILRRTTFVDLMKSLDRVGVGMDYFDSPEFKMFDVDGAISAGLIPNGVVGRGANLKQFGTFHGNNYEGTVNDALKHVIESLNTANSLLRMEETGQGKAELRRQIKKLRKLHDVLHEIKLATLKNGLVDAYVKMMTDAKNRALTLEQVSMDRIKGVIDGLQADRGDEGVFIDLNLPLQQRDVHYEVFSGDSLMGIIANSIKTISYIKSSVVPKTDDKGNAYREKVKLVDGAITFDGLKYDSLQDYEMTKGEDGQLTEAVDEYGKKIPITQTLDGLLNAALDNVKELIAAKINLNSPTANAYLAAISLGIPLQKVVYFFNHPIIVKMSRESNSKKYLSGLKKKLQDAGHNVASPSFAYMKKVLAMSEEEALEYSPENAIGIIQLYEKFNKLGNANFNLSKYLNILSDMPKSFRDVERIMSYEKKIFKRVTDIKQAIKDRTTQKVKAITSEMVLNGAFDGKTSEEQDEILMSISDRVFDEVKNDYYKRLEQSESFGEEVFVYDNNKNFPYDTFILNNPNILEAHKTIHFMNNMATSLMKKYNKALTKQLEKIVAKVGFRAFDDTLMMDKIRNDFFHYLMTGTTVKLNDSTLLDFNISSDYSSNIGKRVIKGNQAWLHDQANILVNRIRNNPNYHNNVFVSALTTSVDDRTYMKKIIFINDKISSEEDVEIYTNAFSMMAKQNPEYEEFVIDSGRNPEDPIGPVNLSRVKFRKEYNQDQQELIKYAVLAHGLQFGRISFANAIPEKVVAAVDRSMQTMLNRILDNDPEDIDTIMDNMAEDFIVKFAANNFRFLSDFGERKPVKNDINEGMEGRLAGFENGFHYAIKFDRNTKEESLSEDEFANKDVNPDGEQEKTVEVEEGTKESNKDTEEKNISSLEKKFPVISRFNNMILKRITDFNNPDHNDLPYVYYTFIGSRFANGNYTFNDELFYKKYRMDKAFDPTVQSRSNERMIGNEYITSPGSNLILRENDTLHIHGVNDMSRHSVDVYRVTKVEVENVVNNNNESKPQYTYSLSYISTKNNLESNDEQSAVDSVSNEEIQEVIEEKQCDKKDLFDF